MKFDTVYLLEGMHKATSGPVFTEVKPDTELNYAVCANLSPMPGLIIRWPERAGHHRYSCSRGPFLCLAQKSSQVTPLCRPLNLARPRNRPDQRMSACCWVAWRSLEGAKICDNCSDSPATPWGNVVERRQQFKSPIVKTSRWQETRSQYCDSDLGVNN